jgi:nucleotide-binding universal stress UspA family protein
MQLIIGYDGSDCSELAMRDLLHAALPQNLNATVVTVADLLVETPYPQYDVNPLVPPPPSYIERVRAQAQQALADARATSLRGMETLQGLFPKWDVRAEAVADSPYWALIKLAESRHADLVVVGSHSRSAIGRVILGSVSQLVLNHCPCSVRIARGRNDGGEPHRPLRIVIGFDGSIDANLAIDAICARQWPAQSVAHVVMALDPRTITHFGALRGWPAAIAATSDEMGVARHQVEQVFNRLHDAGLSAVSILNRSDARHALLHEADALGADTIFMGARGLTRLKRFLLGSTSAAVAARAPCSIEVVRQPPWSQAAAQP